MPWAVMGLEPVSHILLSPASQIFPTEGLWVRLICPSPHLNPETQPLSA